jgi:hypothetical protein
MPSSVISSSPVVSGTSSVSVTSGLVTGVGSGSDSGVGVGVGVSVGLGSGIVGTGLGVVGAGVGVVAGVGASSFVVFGLAQLVSIATNNAKAMTIMKSFDCLILLIVPFTKEGSIEYYTYDTLEEVGWARGLWVRDIHYLFCLINKKGTIYH